ncbi:pilin [bacterium]|nr:pilin [bacterium]
MHSYKKILLSALCGFAVPFIASAQGTLISVMSVILSILDLAIPAVLAIAIIIFFWGIARYMIAEDDSKKNEARNVMIYGIAGIFVIFSIWGIVALLQSSFETTGTPIVPQLPSYPQVPVPGEGAPGVPVPTPTPTPTGPPVLPPAPPTPPAI